MRPAKIDIALPVKPCALKRCWCDNVAYSPAVQPTKIPHFFPDKARALYPAFSMVCQHACRSKRCCGSMYSASVGDMLKNKGSNRSYSSTAPAHWLLVFPATILPG